MANGGAAKANGGGKPRAGGGGGTGGGGAAASIMARQAAFNEAAASKIASARQDLSTRASATVQKIQAQQKQALNSIVAAGDKYRAAKAADRSQNSINQAADNYFKVSAAGNARIKQLAARATRIGTFGDRAAGFSPGGGARMRQSIIRAANRG